MKNIYRFLYFCNPVTGDYLTHSALLYRHRNRDYYRPIPGTHTTLYVRSSAKVGKGNKQRAKKIAITFFKTLFTFFIHHTSLLIKTHAIFIVSFMRFTMKIISLIKPYKSHGLREFRLSMLKTACLRMKPSFCLIKRSKECLYRIWIISVLHPIC